MFGKKAETEVVEEVEHELKFKEWFNLKGIRAEIKNIHWLTKKELFNNSLTVLVFTFVMGLFFFGEVEVAASAPANEAPMALAQPDISSSHCTVMTPHDLCLASSCNMSVAGVMG